LVPAAKAHSGCLVAYCDFVDKAHEDAIGKTRQGLLLLDDGRHARQGRSQHDGSRDIPSCADAHIRRKAPYERERFGHPFGRDKKRTDQPPRKPAREVVDRDRFEPKAFPGDDLLFQTLVSAGENHFRSLFQERLADGERGINVPAGPSPSDQDPHARPPPTALEMLRRTPTAERLTTRDVLPKLTKGRVIPVTGKEPVATPILSIA